MSLALLLARELSVDQAAGFKVVGISAPGPFTEHLKTLGVEHVPLELTRRWDPVSDARMLRQLVQLLRARRVDVLHTHTPKAGVIGRLAGRLSRIPVVVNTCHGLWLGEHASIWKRLFVLAVEGFAAQFSDAELYQNDEDRQRLAWAVPARKARTVGNGIDLERFHRTANGRSRVRAELEVDDGTVLVGGVGRLVAEKGLLELGQVAERLRGRARFVWVGPLDADKPDALDATLENIEFLGLRTDMPDVYSALDIFVLPSHREGFSRSAMEAAACGCAMVLSDIRGCREIGRDSQHLLLTPARDVDALHGKIDQLVGDAALRARLGRAAALRAHRYFDQTRIAEASLDTYFAVAQRKGLSWGGQHGFAFEQ